MSLIEILNNKDAIAITKLNKTEVLYYLFDEFEIHSCKIPAHSSQDWHMHEVIEEIIFVTSGLITVEWMENDVINKKDLPKDTILRVKHSMHNIVNNTNYDADFLVFRMVPTGESKSEIIKNDKIVLNDYHGK